MPVLRRLVADPAVKRLWSGTFDATLARVHACPACRKLMVQVPLRDEGFALDVCKKCSLVWLDASELEAMPERPAPPREPDAPLAVRQRLAIEEVKQQIRRTREETPDLGNLRHWPGLFGMPVEVGGAEIACRPWATWATALAASAVSIAGFAQPGVIDALALVPDRLMESAGFTMVSCFFVHASWWHLLGNLWFLLVFGDNVEDFLGRKRWLLLLGLATIGASLLQVLGDPRGSVPCVGASGGISGLIVFYALRLPKARLATYLSSRYSGGAWITFPAWGGLLVWLLLQGVLLMQQLSGFGNVAALAHLGGAIVGAIAFFVTRNRR